jgi:hypothetical protein
LRTFRSIVAEQFAQVIPVTGNVTLFTSAIHYLAMLRWRRGDMRQA